MIKHIIFLNHEFKEMIEDSGLSLDCLVYGERENHFSSNDLSDIDYMSTLAREDHCILAYYGFGINENTDALQSEKRLIVPKADIEEGIRGFDHKTTRLGAYCPNNETIIIWQLEDDEQHTHHMFKANLTEILNAMTRVMSFRKVLETSQFEMAVLRD